MRQFHALRKLRERIFCFCHSSSSSSSVGTRILLNKHRNNNNHNNNNTIQRCKSTASSSTSSNSSDVNVGVQLDYYMSPQFAGIAAAMVNNLYNQFEISFLPTCPVGLEQERIRNYQNQNPSSISIGSVEQNIFIPTLYDNPNLNLKAVASIFRRSPLCVASLPSTDSTDPTTDPTQSHSFQTIGAHKDTVHLLSQLFPNTNVQVSPRATKISDLLSGKYQGIQAYETTEVPTLRRHLENNQTTAMENSNKDKIKIEPIVVSLEGLNGAKLGYSQVLFATDESLEGDKRLIVKSFLESTFKGWEMVIRDPKEGVKMVEEAKKMLRLDDEGNDHWENGDDYGYEMLQLCNGYVKETFEGDRLGVINEDRWNEATQWLMKNHSSQTNGKVMVDEGFGLDATLWKPSSQLLAGNELARTILEDAKESAISFHSKYGRKPSLGVITVGTLERYLHAERRLQLYSNSSNSWFSKTQTGEANGFDVKEINLSPSATTEELLSEIYRMKTLDGIQVMWPMPNHIDTSAVYNAVKTHQDVDGIHFVGQSEIGNKKAYPPVTPAGTMALMKKHGVELEGKNVLVIGRSPIVGSPLAHMLREEGAVVTVAHSKVPGDSLEKLVRASDVVVSCAGSPGLLKADWLSGRVVVNVGTYFVDEDDGLCGDVEGSLSASASQFSPVPGGVGPLSAAMLFKNVAQAAWDKMKINGSVLESWKTDPECLSKSFHFDTYTQALEFAEKVNQASTLMDHHANMTFGHQCVDGVDVSLQFFSFEAGELTGKDYEAAHVVDNIASEGNTRMKDYTYDLDVSLIAAFPASPRGSSRLVHVDEKGNVSHHDMFSSAIPNLIDGAHLVFNESRVLDARVFIQGGEGDSEIEMMILDLGGVDASLPCQDIVLDVMIRSSGIKVGDKFQINGNQHVEVVGVKGDWIEDEHSNGNGTECFVKILSTESLQKTLDEVGTVPIPPYLGRVVENSDKEAYNTVYASPPGSVAAPTAGLHFTDEVLKQIGEENISFLSLHVGAGTFKPVVCQDARDHEMHGERFSVSVNEIKRIIKALEEGKPLVVVGTTSCRTLESLFWCGVKKMRGFDTDPSNLELTQFEWLPLQVGEGNRLSRIDAFKALVNDLDDDTTTLSGTTNMMIVPGSYDFKVVDHLITNFHAPDSTLMLLVSAFLGTDKIKSVYNTCQEKGYRFLSYGDSCFFSRPKSGAP